MGAVCGVDDVITMLLSEGAIFVYQHRYGGGGWMRVQGPGPDPSPQLLPASIDGDLKLRNALDITEFSHHNFWVCSTLEDCARGQQGAADVLRRSTPWRD